MLLNYYLHGKQYDSAAYYIAKCKQYNSLNNNIEDQQFIKELEVELLIAQNKPCPDISLLKAAAMGFDTTHNYYRARETYMLLMQNAKTQHNVNEALYYLEKHNAVNDSVIKIETRNNWLELDKKYQTEKKEYQIQSQNSKLEKNKIQIAGLLALLLALGLGTILFFVYKKRKQSKKDYENQVQFTASLFEKTEEERKRIATDLHDSVSHELLSLKTENQTEFATINTKIDSIIDEIRSISRNLHPVLFESLGLQ
jgi:two-component system, NarL family, sensor kinase